MSSLIVFLDATALTIFADRAVFCLTPYCWCSHSACFIGPNSSSTGVYCFTSVRDSATGPGLMSANFISRPIRHRRRWCGPLLGPQVRSAQMPRRRGRRAQTMADQHFDPAWVEAWHFRWDIDAACFVRNVWSRREMERPANPTSHCAPGRALSFLISEDRRVGFFPDSLRYSRCFGNPS